MKKNGINQGVKRAKSLDFTLAEIKALLTLNSSDKITCAQIIDKTESKIAEAEIKILGFERNQESIERPGRTMPSSDEPLDICPIMIIYKVK